MHFAVAVVVALDFAFAHHSPLTTHDWCSAVAFNSQLTTVHRRTKATQTSRGLNRDQSRSGWVRWRDNERNEGVRRSHSLCVAY